MYVEKDLQSRKEKGPTVLSALRNRTLCVDLVQRAFRYEDGRNLGAINFYPVVEHNTDPSRELPTWPWGYKLYLLNEL